MPFGDMVRAERERRNWSLAMLAERSGVSKSYLSKIESGESKRIGARVKEKLTLVLGLPDEPAGASPHPTPMVGRLSRTRDYDLPVYRAHAGRLEIAPQGPVDTFSIRMNQTYVVEVTGDCLFDLDIRAGDRLLIDRSALPAPGKVVVVRVGDELLLVRWKALNGMVELELSDGEKREVLRSEIEIQGVATDQIKRLP